MGIPLAAGDGRVVKAKKRVVTARPTRTPTVRKLRSAIVPAPPKPALPSAPRPTRGAPVAHGPSALAGVRAGGAPAEPAEHAAGDGTAAVDLRVDLGRGLVLERPLVAAAGPFGYGVEHEDVVDIGRLGAICTRGTTLKPSHGNVTPRMTLAPAGLLHAVGLPNPGVDAVVERFAPAWQRWPVPVIVNLAATSVGDFVELVRRLDGVPGVAGVELDLACPNAAHGGLRFALDADDTAAVVTAVRRATELPVIAKLSAEALDVRAVARAAADAGADALSAIGPLPAVAVAPDRRRTLLGTAYGGLSGPAIKPIALRVVFEIAQAVKVPVVGMGGVTSLDDVLDLLAVGAAAVGVGTAVLADPALPGRLADELAEACHVAGITSHRDLVGTALPRRPAPPSTRGPEHRP